MVGKKDALLRVPTLKKIDSLVINLDYNSSCISSLKKNCLKCIKHPTLCTPFLTQPVCVN